MLTKVGSLFKKIKTPQTKGNRKKPQSIKDCLMSAVAMFGLKYPSLLQFDKHRYSSEVIGHNLGALYGIQRVPSDTYMREQLDEVDPSEIRKPFKTIFADLQRGRALEDFQFINGYYLLSMDGTGFFSSPKVYCQNCCVKERKDSKEYYHQMFCGSIVHPGQKTVIPFAPEPIMKSDGDTKNDCEFNAVKRFIDNFRREHPHLKVIVLLDSLHGKAPLIKMLKEAGIPFIIGVKPGDHKYLFEFTKDICKEFGYKAKDGKTHQYRYSNDVPLNESNYDLRVNFLDYFEIGSKGEKKHFTWITDFTLSEANVHQIMRGGRCRWKIENETFNTLKNQNYHFEHNFGHGKKNLSTVFGMLMMLAFLIDQVQEHCDALFQKALAKEQRKTYLWEKLRAIFFLCFVSSWEDLWNAIAHGHRATTLQPLNST